MSSDEGKKVTKKILRRTFQFGKWKENEPEREEEKLEGE